VTIGRDVAGRRTSITYKGGVNGMWTYDERQLVESIVWRDPLGVELASFHYVYDPNGDRVGVTQGHVNSTMTADQYDTLRWLAGEDWDGDMDYDALYRYDASGNRIFCQRDFNGSTLDGAVGIQLDGFNQWADSVNATYTIDDDNRLTHEHRTFVGDPPSTPPVFGGLELLSGGTSRTCSGTRMSGRCPVTSSSPSWT
jgi:hypothetical protein